MPRTSGVIGVIRVLVGADITALEKGLNKAAARMGRFSRRMKILGRDLMTSISLPLGLIGGAIGKFAIEFEGAMTKSTAIMGELSAETKKRMADIAKAVTEYTSFSAKEAAESYYYLASAGLDAARSMAALPTVAKFAQAGMFNMARATDLLTDAQSALGKDEKDAAGHLREMSLLADQIVTAANAANASVEQFAEAMGTAGSYARAFNIPTEDVLAVLAAFASQFDKGSEGGTRFGIVIRDLTTKVLKNADAWEEAGIKVFEFGRMRSVIDIIADLEKKFRGLTDEQKKATIIQLDFADKSVLSIQKLLGFSQVMTAIRDRIRAAGGALNEISTKQMTALDRQLEQLKNQLIVVAIDLGETFLPVLKAFVAEVKKIIPELRAWAKSFDNLSDETKKWILIIWAAAIALGPVIYAVASLISAISLLVPLLIKTVVILASLSTGLVGVALAFGVLAIKAGGFGNAFKSIILSISYLVTSAIEKMIGAVEAFFGLFSRRMAEAVDRIQEDFRYLRQFIEDEFYLMEHAAEDMAKKSSDEMQQQMKEAAKAIKKEIDDLAKHAAQTTIAPQVGIKGEDFPLIEVRPILKEIRAAQVTAGLMAIIEGADDLTYSLRILEAEAEILEQELGRMVAENPYGEMTDGLQTTKARLEEIREAIKGITEEQTRLAALRKPIEGINDKIQETSQRFFELREAMTALTDPARFGTTAATLARMRQELLAMVPIMQQMEMQQALINAEIQTSRNSAEGLRADFVATLAEWVTQVQSFGQLVGSTLGMAFGGAADALGRAVAYSEDLGEAIRNVGRRIVADIISGIIKGFVAMIAQRLIFMTTNLVSAATEVAAILGGYAALTYAAVFSSIAAIPIIGPALAPGAAAAATTAMLAKSAAFAAVGKAIGLGLGIAAGEEGGIITRPTLLLAGEHFKPEALTPLEDIENLFSPRSMTVEVYLDGETIARNQVQRIPEILRLQGMPI